MTPCFARLRLAALLSLTAFAARAQPATAVPPPLPTNPAPTTGPREDDPLVQIKLPDADLDSILTALEMYTGRTVLRPAQLPTTTYNIKIDKPVPKSQAILAIETVLALNNVGVVKLGDRFLVVTQLAMTARNSPEMITGSAFDHPASGKIAVKVFQLEFLRVAEVQQLMQQILNPGTGTQVIPLQNANAMMVTDSVANLQRVEVLLQQLDRPVSAGMKPKFYQLKNGAKASDLVQKIRTILQGTLQIQLGTATSYQADDRTNQIVLVTDPRQHPFFDELIDRLDVRADPNTRNDVIYLNHAKAVDLVNVLSRVITGQTQAAQRQNPQSVRPGMTAPPANQPAQQPAAPIANPSVNAALEGMGTGSNEFSALMTVAPDERSNSVVVSGTADDIRLITELIKKLDTILAQVRIEVVIAEVTLDNNHDSGIGQLGLQVDGNKLIGFSGSGAGFSVAGSAGTGFATITRGASGAWDLAGTIALGTTRRRNNTTILTVPAVTTSHGKKAVINDGETRPVITGTTTIPGAATGATTSSQIQQQQIGTTLTVTPFIGNDGSVQLELLQELTDVIDTVTVDNNTQYVIGTRRTENYITARDGEIIVLSGFRKKIDSRQTSRLGPIPIIGDIFGSRKKDRYHQELIFFLRPQILTNNPATDNADTMRKVDQLPTRDEIKQQLDPNFQPAPKSVLDRILPQ
ncbi:MAG: hypothetical protein RIQ93_1040 [Verrucomicrobiota bacterium]|jgi:general secretion pathway protein D